MLKVKHIVITLVILFLTQTLAAEENLLGNWGGIKSKLEENGISAESVIAFDTLSNVDGGIEKGSAILGNFDLLFTIDTAKAGLWQNGTIFLYGLGNFGDSISELSGEAQVASNIEAYGTFKLYEAWYEHSFSENISLLLGLHDYNSEFYSLEHAAGLINSSFGIGIDTAQVGPSIFSTTALAARVKLTPSESTYLLFAAYDGIPGSPSDPVGTQIAYSSDDGVFYAAEAGLLGSEDNYYKLGLGAWYHTTDFTDYKEEAHSYNNGVHLIAEKTVTNDLGIFFQIGYADEDKNQFEHYIGTGISYNAPFSSRPDDLLSAGVAIARNGNDYKNLNDSDSSETAFEVNYRIQATSFLAITPDLQYIVNPGTDKTIDDAVIIGFRTELAL